MAGMEQQFRDALASSDPGDGPGADADKCPVCGASCAKIQAAAGGGPAGPGGPPPMAPPLGK